MAALHTHEVRIEVKVNDEIDTTYLWQFEDQFPDLAEVAAEEFAYLVKETVSNMQRVYSDGGRLVGSRTLRCWAGPEAVTA
jgi:hypothetical protein